MTRCLESEEQQKDFALLDEKEPRESQGDRADKCSRQFSDGIRRNVERSIQRYYEGYGA
jgi:hypothetical protein